MTFWSTNSIQSINTGHSPNDGTGDDIRDAFLKVDNNLGNISTYLSSTNIDFLNANVETQFNVSGAANIANLTVGNVTGTQNFYGNLNVYGNIIPGGTYNLGSPSAPFANLYVQTTVSTTQLTQSSDASLLIVQANAAPGDVKDLGIIGNVSSNYSSNAYAFFGHQYASGNFVYKITPNNAATVGNSVVYDGFYAGAQFGSAILSNTTPGGNTLVVAGNTSIAGNLSLGSNLYVNGFQALTTSTIGYYGSPFTGGIITGTAAFVASQPSTSPATGVIIIPNGGLGVSGNVYASGNVVATTGLVGPYYGTIQTAVQPNITTVGTIGNLTVAGATTTNTLQATTIGATTATIGTLNLTTLSGLTLLNVAGNVTASSFVGPVYGAQTNITGVGTLTGLTVSGNVAIASTLYAQGIYDNGNRVLSTSSSAGNLAISGTLVTLPATGPGATTVGSTTQIPVITTDNYGRIAGLTTASISTTLNISGSTGTGTVALSNQTLRLATGTGIATAASGNTITITNTGVTSAVAGTAISISGATGAVTINNTGVTSAVAGTGVSVSGATGAVTFSIGQAVSPANSPTFAGLTVPSITHYGTSGVGDIGASGSTFGTVYATATTALYADLAENYLADADYTPGTVVVFGGDKEITTTTTFADPRVAGAISTDPAYLMNGACGGLPLALRGRIPCQVVGPVTKGDLLVTSQQAGYAISVGASLAFSQAVFAKALETDLTDGKKIIEVVIL